MLENCDLSRAATIGRRDRTGDQGAITVRPAQLLRRRDDRRGDGRRPTRRRRGAAPPGRHRDVPRQARGTQQGRDLRAVDGAGRRRPRRARGRAAARDPQPGDLRRLPAGGRPADRHRDVGRGPGAMDERHAGSDRADPLRRARRADEHGRRARPGDDRVVVPVDPRRRRPGHPASRSACRSTSRRSTSTTSTSSRGCSACSDDEDFPADAADRRGHRDRGDARSSRRRQPHPTAPRARHTCRDRRLRHRLLVARLPRAVPDRLREDRPAVRRADRGVGSQPQPGRVDEPDGPLARPHRRRRGRRDARAGADVARHGIRVGAGLLLRPSDPRRRADRRHRQHPARHRRLGRGDATDRRGRRTR